MAGDIQLISLGGTLLMKDEGEGHAPFYNLRDVMLYRHLDQLEAETQDMERIDQLRHAKQLLIEGAAARYVDIGRLIVGDPHCSGNDALMRIHQLTKRGGAADFGCSKDVMTMPYGPIDSINFDVETHYPALREAVLTAIRNGDVPVIAGGTDTLRYYGSLLAEDMAQLKASGVLKHLPPILVVSSMLAFGDTEQGLEQRHVYRLLQSARVAASEAVAYRKEGVHALLPRDAEVSSVSLLDLRQPCDKISATMPKAFVGTEVLTVDPDRPVSGKVYPPNDPRRYADGMAKHIPPFRRNPVMPPLESQNSTMAITELLWGVLQNPSYGYNSVILKGNLDHASVGDMGDLVTIIAALGAKGIPVFCVNDPQYDLKSKQLQGDPYFDRPAHRQRHATLEKAGVIFVDNMTSTQVHIRAGMADAKGNPIHFVEEREAAGKLAQSYHETHPVNVGLLRKKLHGVTEKHLGARHVNAFAVEYVPDQPAYETLLTLAHDKKFTHVVSVNCTDGSMSAAHAPLLKTLKGSTQVIGSFKQAGRRIDGANLETASMKRYAPAVELSSRGLVVPGGDRKPMELVRAHQSLGYGR